MEGEEGGGWEVGDDDLELPPNLVSEHEEWQFLFYTPRNMSGRIADWNVVKGLHSSDLTCVINSISYCCTR